MKKDELKALINVQETTFRFHRSDLNKVRFQLIKNKIRYITKYDRKRISKKILVTLVVAGSLFGSWIYFIHNPLTVIMREKANDTHEVVYLQDSTKNMKAFLDKIGFMESGNNYRAVNQYGYCGRFQFGREALTAIGLGGVSTDDFINNPELQEVAMKMLLKKNKETLARYIGKYQNRKIAGIFITESSILGASQMAPKGVIDFLDSGGQNVFKDGNGAPISKYLKDLSGYKLEF